MIGSDGTCKMCGRAAPNWGDERKRGLVDESSEDDEEYEDDDEEYEDEDEDAVAAADGAPAVPEWSERKLCSDGACWRDRR